MLLVAIETFKRQTSSVNFNMKTKDTGLTVMPWDLRPWTRSLGPGKGLESLFEQSSTLNIIQYNNSKQHDVKVPRRTNILDECSARAIKHRYMTCNGTRIPPSRKLEKLRAGWKATNWTRFWWKFQLPKRVWRKFFHPKVAENSVKYTSQCTITL